MITITKGEFQKNVSAYLKKVEETGEEIIITENKIPSIKIISITDNDEPFTDETVDVKHHGDILEEKIEQKSTEWEEF